MVFNLAKVYINKNYMSTGYPLGNVRGVDLKNPVVKIGDKHIRILATPVF